MWVTLCIRYDDRGHSHEQRHKEEATEEEGHHELRVERREQCSFCLRCVCGCRDASEEESSRFAFAETRKLSGVKNEIAFCCCRHAVSPTLRYEIGRKQEQKKEMREKR